MAAFDKRTDGAKNALDSATSGSRAVAGDGSHIASSAPTRDGRSRPTREESDQEYPLDTCIPQLVAMQAHAAPDAPALAMGEQMLTYAELNRSANQLAHYLRSLGVGRESLVGVCLERSVDMVVSMLAAMKAGGAYLAMDPGYPAERLAFMLQDARAPVLVARRDLASTMAVGGVEVISLDADQAALTHQAVDDPPPVATAQDLAYVIYTSGSTGQPKGVEIAHASLLNLIYWHRQAFGVTASDRATQLSSPAFDATGWELWPYLTAGASVYLAPEETRSAPSQLRDWLVSQAITNCFAPTPVAEALIALPWPAETELRFLLTGADTLHHYPPADLPFTVVNNYGPTEATVVATSGTVPAGPHAGGDAPSIGRPIANTQIYLLDDALHQVPVGVPGELYIGGAGLARGYRNRPELTADRFIPHPFSSVAGERVYRTGDLARYLPNGEIAFLGRADYQVKIRGYRVEPEEIVSVLNAHPAVQTSMVVAGDGGDGEKRLIAYVVPVPGASPDVGSLHAHLQAYLPDYMIPATFVRMDALPTTPNGKVDRQALPAPDADNTMRDDVGGVPATVIEEGVAEMVRDLLRLERVGTNGNFFLLGGHSMLGTQLIARIADTFGVELPLHTLFEFPTVAQLSREVEGLIVAKLSAMSDDQIQRLLA